MIKKLEKKDINKLKQLLKGEYLQNPYLYIDAVSFGFEGENIDTHILYGLKGIGAVLYRYYNSLQMCVFDNDISFDEITEFIVEHGFEMVSGSGEVIRRLEPFCSEYTAGYGVIMSFSGSAQGDTGAARLATPEDCKEIAELICSDASIGGHYTVDILCDQLKDRMINWNCINGILRENGIITAHAATYADCNDFAIIGGVITHKDYRGRGLGGKIVLYLTKKILSAGKKPLLYCYDQNTVNWYKKIGWEIVCDCGKLERRKKSK